MKTNLNTYYTKNVKTVEDAETFHAGLLSALRYDRLPQWCKDNNIDPQAKDGMGNNILVEYLLGHALID